MTTVAYGAAIRLTTTVKQDGALAAPATISLSVMLPDGTTAGPYEPVDDGVGLYHYDYVPGQAGRHIARWTTTGPTGAREEPFDVAAEWGEAGLVSLADAKAHLNMEGSDEDAELAEVIRAAGAVVERIKGSVARRVHVEDHSGGFLIALHHPPVLAVTAAMGVHAGVPDPVLADLTVDSTSGVVRMAGGEWIAGPVRITYMAGASAVPPEVRMATLIIVQHLWETQRGAALPRFGTDEAWDPRLGFAIPRRALELLGESMSGIA